jgi:ribonuclease VapC
MIVDTSALLAVLLREPEAASFAAAIESAEASRLSVASYLEAAIFVDRHGDEVRRAMLDTFLEEFSIQLEPVTVEQVRVARQAFQWFGKGIHPAALNFGDCFTYALAKVTREPVLFKGNDFSRTDLVPAVPPAIRPA